MNGDIFRKGHSDWLITAVGNSNCSECHNFLFRVRIIGRKQASGTCNSFFMIFLVDFLVYDSLTRTVVH